MFLLLLASPAFPTQEPFDSLEIGQGSKFGKGQMMVSFLITSLQMGDMNELLTSVLGPHWERKKTKGKLA